MTATTATTTTTLPDDDLLFVQLRPHVEPVSRKLLRHRAADQNPLEPTNSTDFINQLTSYEESFDSNRR